jgi:hypothetical protein
MLSRQQTLLTNLWPNGFRLIHKVFMEQPTKKKCGCRLAAANNSHTLHHARLMILTAAIGERVKGSRANGGEKSIKNE